MTPPELAPGQQFRIIFVTRTTTAAASTSLATYDAVVSGDALAGGLATYRGQAVTWEAIASTPTVNAIDRLPADSVPLFLPDGTLIAPTGVALWNTLGGPPLLHPINELASGARAPLPYVWTGTPADGLSNPLYVFGGILPAVGSTYATDKGWTIAGVSPTTGFYSPLYGFSSVLTVPQLPPPPPPPAPVPEPSSLALFGLGVAALAGWRWRSGRRAV
jgi:hypothetical protein